MSQWLCGPVAPWLRVPWPRGCVSQWLCVPWPRGRVCLRPSAGREHRRRSPRGVNNSWADVRAFQAFAQKSPCLQLPLRSGVVPSVLSGEPSCLAQAPPSPEAGGGSPPRSCLFLTSYSSAPAHAGLSLSLRVPRALGPACWKLLLEPPVGPSSHLRGPRELIKPDPRTPPTRPWSGSGPAHPREFTPGRRGSPS